METKTIKKKAWTLSDWQLFCGASLGFIFLFVFAYLPMVGMILAFKDGDFEADLLKVMLTGEWVGLRNFRNFWLDMQFKNIMLNTAGLNLLMLFINFPAPIIFALLLNEVTHSKFKRVAQSVTIFPHFLSWTIFGGIILAVTNMNSGIINPILNVFRLSSPGNPINLAKAEYTWVIIIISSLIKNAGWSSIIYLAAITGVSPSLYEAAEIDGAGRFKQMYYITLPSIAQTITVYFLLALGNFFTNSFEQFYIFQNGVNLSRSEVLTTYIYKMGIGSGTRKFSYTAAMGIFESIIGFALLVIGNFISKKTTSRGIF